MAMCQQKVFQGEYQCIYKDKKQPAWIQIHYEKNGTILFYFTANTGGDYPSLGELYGRLTFDKKNRHLHYSSGDTTQKYSLDIEKVSGRLIITEHGISPYGHRVYADGTYEMISSSNPLSFIDLEGKKIFFSKTTPEKYYKGW